ncbi:MAG: hypothetical protein NC043_06590 [Muribaculaceae bacterium]|nr:hypothetical protein [Muribaculaceae bacterium]
MKGSDLFRLICIALLWLALCYLLVTRQPFSLRVILIIIGSGIIVFVPLYKKYRKASKK